MNTHGDSIQNIIIYVAIMNYCNVQDIQEKLELFEEIRELMDDSMAEFIFSLLIAYYGRKKRIHPLFYYLSNTEHLFYTQSDSLRIKEVEDMIEERLFLERIKTRCEKTEEGKAEFAKLSTRMLIKKRVVPQNVEIIENIEIKNFNYDFENIKLRRQLDVLIKRCTLIFGFEKFDIQAKNSFDIPLGFPMKNLGMFEKIIEGAKFNSIERGLKRYYETQDVQELEDLRFKCRKEIREMGKNISPDEIFANIYRKY